MRLGDKLEKLREQHEQGLINSIEFLKMLLELAREAAQAEKEVVPEEEIDKGKGFCFSNDGRILASLLVPSVHVALRAAGADFCTAVP